MHSLALFVKGRNREGIINLWSNIQIRANSRRAPRSRSHNSVLFYAGTLFCRIPSSGGHVSLMTVFVNMLDLVVFPCRTGHPWEQVLMWQGEDNIL